MKQLIQQITRQQLAMFFCCALLTALIYSKYALSVFMFALFFMAFLSFDVARRFPVYLNPMIKKNLQQMWQYKPYLVVGLFFWIVLLSGFYSTDQAYWLERLRLKIPFLLFPFAFASIPAFSRRQYLSLFYFLLLLMFVSCVDVGTNYLRHFEEITRSMNQGQSIPTPMNHIRFSLVLALSIIGGAYLFLRNYYLKFPWERYLIGFLTGSLFVFIHILSVRSGLIALYLAILILGFRYVVATGRILPGVITLVLLISLPLLAYQWVPSFRAKARYAIYDLEMYWSEGGKNYSDGERIISLKVGMNIGRAHPLLGVGAGDLEKEVAEIYRQQYPQMTPKMPHNQFVSVFAGSGLLGLVAFVFAFLFPLLYRKNYRAPLFLALHLIIFLSFLMENTLETSIGIALYCTLLLLSLNFLSGRRSAMGTSAES